MEREQAVRLTQNLLKKMVERNGSDLFITTGFPPAIKVDGTIHQATDAPLSPEQSAMMVRSIMNDKQIKEFDATKECNFAISPQGIGRFRVSAFIQQGYVGAVLRTITTEIPTLEDLELPPILKDVVMNKRGLVIVVGGTGSGKSTTLAAMIDYVNTNRTCHIMTIEDPIEFLIRGQRRIGRLVDRAVDFDRRRETTRDEEVRAVPLDHLPKQVLYQSYRLFAFHLSPAPGFRPCGSSPRSSPCWRP